MGIDQGETIFIDGHFHCQVEPCHGIVEQVGLDGSNGARIGDGFRQWCWRRLWFGSRLRFGFEFWLRRRRWLWFGSRLRFGFRLLFHFRIDPNVRPSGITQVRHDVGDDGAPRTSAVEGFESLLLLLVADGAVENLHHTRAVGPMVTDLHFLAQTVPVFGRRLEADGQSCRFATLKKMLKKKLA